MNTWNGFTPLSTVYASVAAINANSVAAVTFPKEDPALCIQL